MPALVRPRSATAKLSWSSSRRGGSTGDGDDAARKPAQRPASAASARHLPKGRTTLTELDKILLEAEAEANRPPPPPKPLTDAEIADQQRREWEAKDGAFDRAAEEREREERRLYELAQREKRQVEEEAAVDAEHDKAVQARLRRLGEQAEAHASWAELSLDLIAVRRRDGKAGNQLLRQIIGHRFFRFDPLLEPAEWEDTTVNREGVYSR